MNVPSRRFTFSTSTIENRRRRKERIAVSGDMPDRPSARLDGGRHSTATLQQCRIPSALHANRRQSPRRADAFAAGLRSRLHAVRDGSGGFVTSGAWRPMMDQLCTTMTSGSGLPLERASSRNPPARADRRTSGMTSVSRPAQPPTTSGRRANLELPSSASITTPLPQLLRSGSSDCRKAGAASGRGISSAAVTRRQSPLRLIITSTKKPMMLRCHRRPALLTSAIVCSRAARAQFEDSPKRCWRPPMRG
jgi:hypothetical protein